MTSPAPETAPAAAVSPLALTLFGPMRVLVSGRLLPRLHSRKSLWLLALLALRSGRPVEREWLAGTLWPDANQEQAFANLRPVLSDLRRALGREGVRLQSLNRHTLCLDLAGADVDVLAFDAAVARGVPDALAEAVASYTGPLLEGCVEEWAVQERRAREEECLRALQTLADLSVAAGDYGRSAEYYRRAMALDPWRDAARRGLMEALSQAGDVNAALQVYREFTALLRSDPKAAPDAETSALYARLRAEAKRGVAGPPVAAAGGPAPTVTGYLPHPLTELIGREDERLEVAARLRRSRLVTLTGPGGIGKTRLAVAVAEEVAGEFGGGVWLVPLETLFDGAQIPARIAGLFGLKEELGRTLLEVLVFHLRGKRLLLVLDNCEHLLEATAEVAVYLLRECPGLRILATSREALGMTGEVAWAVPGLAVPDPAHLPAKPTPLVAVLMSYEGVRLFVERAGAVQKTFVLTGDNARMAAEVCARLGGIPLALELAAARVRAMTVEQMSARLGDHLDLLPGGDRAAPSRQRTLRATLDWSYALLTEPEQILLARLSVFAGGWTLEAVEQVCADGAIKAGEVDTLLAGLVDKSLVSFDGETSGRYRLLEVVRRYAAEKLASVGEADTICAVHRDWFLRVAEAAPDVRGPEGERGRQILEAEHDNMRQALAWCGGDPDGGMAALRLVNKMMPILTLRGHYAEGRKSLEQALAHPDAQDVTIERARALEWSVIILRRLDEHSAARAQATELLDLQRQRGDKNGIGDGLTHLGNACIEAGDTDEAKALYEECLAVYRDGGDPSRIAAGLASLAYVLVERGEYAAAQPLYEQSLEIHRANNDKAAIGIILAHLGSTMRQQGNHAVAQGPLEEGLAILRDFRDDYLTAQALYTTSVNAYQLGDYTRAEELIWECLLIARDSADALCAYRGLSVMSILLAPNAPVKAARLLAAADALSASGGRPLPSEERTATAHLIDELRQSLGEERLSTCWTEGCAMTRERAVEYALEETEGGVHVPPRHATAKVENVR